MRFNSLLVCGAVTSCAVASPSATIPTYNVTYHGISVNGIEKFLNIPFGLDTSGENRFAPPRPAIPESDSHVFATSYGPACPQPTNDAFIPLTLNNVTTISEDCLNLNIARPASTSPNDTLPVMVYIYGGGLWEGANNALETAPDGLILESVDNGLPVIHVAMNYRLNMFGFALSDALHSASSLNAGLRDQRLAIEWVKDNIAHFGGDPSRITIFGQSSGGLSVGMQIMAYGGERAVPFTQAICESQALEPGITGNYTQDAFTQVVALTRCNASDPNSNATLTCLRSLSTAELLNATMTQYATGSSSNGGDIWLPTVDGSFLPAAPSRLIRSGRFARIPVIMGWCADDMTIFTDPSISTPADTTSFISTWLPNLNQTLLTSLLALYPSSSFSADPTANLSAEFHRAARIATDVLMACEPLFYGAALARHAPNNNTRVYHYIQNQTLLAPILAREGYPGLGVFHESEFAYVFGNLSHYDINGYAFAPSAADYALMRRQSRSWSSFASLGVPSVGGKDTLQGWEGSGEEGNATSVFVIGGPEEGLSRLGGEGAVGAVEAWRLEERCAFLNREDVVKQIGF